MDVIVPGRSDPEIGALLREGLNTKEKNLLRNNEMADYMGALDILQNEYGKPALVINDVNADLDKLKPPTGDTCKLEMVMTLEGAIPTTCPNGTTMECTQENVAFVRARIIVLSCVSKTSQSPSCTR